MRILFVCCSDPRIDCRVRKELKWLRQRGFDDIGILFLFGERPENVVFWHAAMLDGYPLFAVNSRAASMVRDVVAQLKPDVVHVHELDALWPLLAEWDAKALRRIEAGSTAADSGVRISRPKGLRIIYDAHEYEPARHMPRQGPGGAVERRQRDRLCVPHVDEMIVVSPSIVRQTERDHGITPHLVPNTLPREAARQPRRAANDEQRTVVFSGAVTWSRGLKVAARAVELLGWRLKLVGPANKYIAADLMRHAGVELVGKKPYPYWGVKQSMLDHLAGADLALNFVDLSVPSYQMALPNKIFEYAWAGVFSISNKQHDVADLYRDYHIGAVVDADGRDDLTLAEEIDSAEHLAGHMLTYAGIRIDSPWFVQEWCFEATGGEVLDRLYLGEQATLTTGQRLARFARRVTACAE